MIHAKAQAILPDIPQQSIDLVLADPPWIAPAEATTKDRDSHGYARNWSDLGTLELAFDAVFKEFKRIVKPTGAVMVFCGGASGCVFFPMLWTRFRSCRFLIWAKKSGRVNPLFSNTHEKIIYAYNANDHARIGDRAKMGFPDVICQNRVLGSARIHPSQKPVELFEFLIRVAAPAGGTVLDPFAGSFAACQAARNVGRRFVGIEQDAEFYRRAVARFGEKREALL